MTVTHAFTGYGNVPYGSLPYGTGTAQGSTGLQFESVIVSDKDNGLQFESFVDDDKANGFELLSIVNTGSNNGLQFESVIPDTLNAQGLQFESLVQEYLDPQGFQFFATNLGYNCLGYGALPYGVGPYGGPICVASGATQFESIVNSLDSNGLQFKANAVDFLEQQGVQFESVILDYLNNNGIQFESFIVDELNNNGIQFKIQIIDYENPRALQFEAVITDFLNPQGFQFEVLAGLPAGMQFRVNLYNSNRVRILCDFVSRGLDYEPGAPTNAWGNDRGTGQSWKTNSQASGDFDINNVNTDIVEFVYRSTTTTGLQLSCDTEIGQGVFIDTLAILNHNMTTGATINLIGSDTSNFSIIGTTIPLIPRLDNIYYIAETLPLQSFRYWRIDIDDASNTNSYIEIGTIIFGSAQIFQGECIVDRLVKRTRHFADSVRTEGFTSVKNDRSIKTSVSLQFTKLEYSKGNFQALDAIFKSARTSQKCLWIPTPSPTDPSFTERFAVFAKMTEIPEQEHLIMGPDEGDFIDLTVNLDEAE